MRFNSEGAAKAIRKFAKRNQTGQAILLLALSFVVLLFFVGIVTDISLLYIRYAALRRAVDSAAVAAAGQLRNDPEQGYVGTYTRMRSSAMQFLEFYGVEPSRVDVQVCLTVQDLVDPVLNPTPKDAEIALVEELCDNDRKLVRVVAQIDSPTVFMHLIDNFFPGSGLTFDTITLQAAAVSETASLEVVMVLDVSRSMLEETTYNTWNENLLTTANGQAQNRQFARYLPVRLNDAHVWYLDNNPNANVDPDYLKHVGNGASRDFNRAFLSEVTENLFQLYWDTSENPSTPVNRFQWRPLADAAVSGFNPIDFTPAEYYMDGTTPRVINPGSPVLRVGGINGVSATTNYDSDGDGRYDLPNNVVRMRPDCRVRIYPNSWINGSLTDYNPSNLTDTNYLLGQYRALTASAPRTRTLASGETIGVNTWGAGGRAGYVYDFFMPAYDFFGCCNDPSAGATVSIDGVINTSSADFSTSDNDFSDVVCQPFKQAKDAARLFLENIDFLRGDRVAFVTFDRSAYLIDPDGKAEFGGGARSHMIDNLELARSTLNRLIGVGAEPNYYYTDHQSSAAADANGFKPLDSWNSFSRGVEVAIPADVNGDGVLEPGEGFINAVPLDLEAQYENIPVGLINNGYHVRVSCPYFNAAQTSAYTLWTLPGQTPPLLNIMNPPIETNINWQNTYKAAMVAAGFSESRYAGEGPFYSYENAASCRGTNIGAGLREANNALVDPQTTRSEGAVWVIILLSDGAAGATDPIRTAANQPLSSIDPYRRSPDTGDYQNPANPLGADYGVFGFCPYGTYDAPRSYAQINGVWAACVDTDPNTRHSCNTDLDNDPWAKVSDAEIEGVLAQTLTGNPNGGDADCQTRYDADDYARDWADFVARDRRSLAGEQLPAIYTIGFNLTYPNTPSGSQTWCSANPASCLGEELLRYIADIGDNSEYNADYPNSANNASVRGRDYGNYYNAPDNARLREVFDEIAGKLFTRIAG